MRLLIPFLILSLLGAGCAPTQNLGTSESGAQWVIFNKFFGYQTKYDQEKIQDGAMANGQNTTSNDTDRISIRNFGYDTFPADTDASATTTLIETLHTFRKRDGSQILIRAVSDDLEYYDTVSKIWENLNDSYTSADFGFADSNINTDQQSYTYFGNAVEPFSKWNGAITNLDGASSGSDTIIQVDSVDDFSDTGTLRFCGADYTYTFASATGTYFVLSSAAAACADNRGIAETVTEYSTIYYPRGNIYLSADNRLFISGVASSTQVVYFSAYGDNTDFGTMSSLVTDSTDASAGLFNLAEGGGAVNALVFDEGSIYALKKSLIYKMTLTDTIYTVQPLKTFDQKSQTTGAVGKRSTFVSSNGVVFITPDNQIMALERVESIDTPRLVAISDPIQPTVRAADFSSASGITYRDRLFISAKTTPSSSVNDVVFVYNYITGMWDSPIVGWNVQDWAIYQNSNTEDLYFGDSSTYNVYKIVYTPSDGNYDLAANWRSKQHDFGAPYAQKYLENTYVEGYISENTTLTISLLLDEDGYTQKLTTTLEGTEASYLFKATTFNLFGLLPFGTTRFGAQDDQSAKKKFRVFLGKGFRQIPFHNIQIEFASDGDNQSWEVTNYGFLVKQLPVPEKRELMKSF